MDKGEESDTIIKLFRKKVQQSYIADGHHRVKTALILHQTDNKNEVMDTRIRSVLSLYFSWDNLSIFDFNRCAELFQSISPLEFMAALSRICNIKKLKLGRKPKKKHELTMLLYGEWYKISWKKKILKKHADQPVLFDTFLLNEYIFRGIVGLQDIRDDFRVKYVEGIAGLSGLEEMVSKSQNRVGFCIYPISPDELKKMADLGLTLPPKSTWFEPRVKNGLLVKEF